MSKHKENKEMLKRIQRCYTEIWHTMSYPISMKGKLKADDILKREFPSLVPGNPSDYKIHNQHREGRERAKNFVKDELSINENVKIKLIGYNSDSAYDITIPPQKSVITNPKKITKEKFSWRKKYNKEIPIQSTPITIENFFICTYGVFIEIKIIPDGFEKFFKSKESSYYTNADKSILIRSSNHWGHMIKFCSWYLKGYGKESSYRWQKKHGKGQKFGIINISEFKINPAFHAPSK